MGPYGVSHLKNRGNPFAGTATNGLKRRSIAEEEERSYNGVAFLRGPLSVLPTLDQPHGHTPLRSKSATRSSLDTVRN
jgi:hypothetical protein